MATRIIVNIDPTQTQFLLNDAIPVSYPAPPNLVTLAALAANTTYNLPAGSSKYLNNPLILINENTGTSFFYTISPTIIGSDGMAVSQLKNSTAYVLQWDGTNWNIVSQTSFSYGEIQAIKTITANYTAAISDDTIINTSSAGAAITLTLPTGAVFTGKTFQIVNANATASGTITLTPAVKVDNATTTASMAISSRLRVQFDGTNWWELP